MEANLCKVSRVWVKNNQQWAQVSCVLSQKQNNVAIFNMGGGVMPNDTTSFIEYAKALIIARANKMGLAYSPDDIVHIFEADWGDIVWLRTIWGDEVTTTGTATKVAIPVMSAITNATYLTGTKVDTPVRLWCRLPQLIITRDLTGEIHSLNDDIVPFDITDSYTGVTYDMTQLGAAQHKG